MRRETRIYPHSHTDQTNVHYLQWLQARLRGTARFYKCMANKTTIDDGTRQAHRTHTHTHTGSQRMHARRSSTIYIYIYTCDGFYSSCVLNLTSLVPVYIFHFFFLLFIALFFGYYCCLLLCWHRCCCCCWRWWWLPVSSSLPSSVIRSIVVLIRFLNFMLRIFTCASFFFQSEHQRLLFVWSRGHLSTRNFILVSAIVVRLSEIRTKRLVFPLFDKFSIAICMESMFEWIKSDSSHTKVEFNRRRSFVKCKNGMNPIRTFRMRGA